MARKKDKKEDTPLLLFTSTLGPARADLVARIPGPTEANKFRTAPFSHAIDPNTGNPWQEIEIWLQAARLPGTELWSVTRHERYVLGGGTDITTHSQKTVLPDVCFFDALHYCARHEVSEYGLKHALVPPRAPEKDIPVFQDIARAAAQPLNQNGLPHPALNGTILIDGDFDEDQVMLATNGKSRALLPAPVTPPSAALTLLHNTLAQSQTLTQENALQSAAARLLAEQNEHEKKEKNKEKERELLAKTLSAAQHYDFFMDVAVWYSFVPPSKKPFSDKGLFVYGLAPITFIPMTLSYIAASQGSWLYSYEHGAKVNLRRLRETLSALPDSKEKLLLQDFAKAAPIVWGLEEAAAFYKRAKIAEKQKKTEKLLARGLNSLQQAAQKSGLDAVQTETLKSAYLDGNFPEPGTFHKRLNRVFRQAVAGTASRFDVSIHSLITFEMCGVLYSETDFTNIPEDDDDITNQPLKGLPAPADNAEGKNPPRPGDAMRPQL